jgi:hypothetical protein
MAIVSHGNAIELSEVIAGQYVAGVVAAIA